MIHECFLRCSVGECTWLLWLSLELFEPGWAERCRKMPEARGSALRFARTAFGCKRKSASDLRDAVWHLLHTCCVLVVSLAPARSKHVQPDPLPVFPIIRALSRRLNQRWDLSWHCETSLEHAWTEWCRITLEHPWTTLQHFSAGCLANKPSARLCS